MRGMFSYQDAKRRHAMLTWSEDDPPAHGLTDAQVMNNVLTDAEQTALWDTITGREYPKTKLSDAAMMTMPQEHVALLRSASGIPAAFLMLAVGEVVSDYLAKGRDAFADILDFEFRNTIMPKVWEAFAKRRALADNVQEGFGWDRSKAWETVREVGDDQYRQQMVEAIARLAGRMYRSMVGLKVKRRTDQPEEVKDITIGGDLSLLLASEHAQMGMPGGLGDIKTLDVLKRQAQQLRMMGEATCSRGPLVVCVDESGSMHDIGDAQGRNTWAKACLMALTRIAHEDNRMVVCVHFSGVTDVDRLPPGDHLAVYRAITRFMGGGTAIWHALDVGMCEVEQLKKEGQTGADIVLVTDGEDWEGERHYPRIVKEMAKQETRLWTVAIEVNISSNNLLRKSAAKYVHVHGTSLNEGAAKGLEEAAFAEPRRTA